MSKIFFNLFQDSKKDGEFFISHPSNGARGSAKKAVSKNGNSILIFDLTVGDFALKGVFNKTDPAKAKPGGPQIWASVEEGGGKKYRLAGWWTTTKKSGEAVKAPYFSCSIQEELSDTAEPAAPAQAPADDFDSIPF